MRRRVKLTLSEETLRLLDRLAAKGSRSRLIDKAIGHFVAEQGRRRLRARLKEGPIKRAARDLRPAEEP